jgi:hypothetical protein
VRTGKRLAHVIASTPIDTPRHYRAVI